MNRAERVLIGLAPAKGQPFTPVQVQKLFFVLDARGQGDFLGEEIFRFQPYDFGPFDKDVYQELEKLAQKGLVEINYDSAGLRNFRLTLEGQKEADTLFHSMDEHSRKYVQSVSNWIRKQSFHSLLSAIYNEFPDMAVNSVFGDRR